MKKIHEKNLLRRRGKGKIIQLETPLGWHLIGELFRSMARRRAISERGSCLVVACTLDASLSAGPHRICCYDELDEERDDLVALIDEEGQEEVLADDATGTRVRVLACSGDKALLKRCGTIWISGLSLCHGPQLGRPDGHIDPVK